MEGSPREEKAEETSLENEGEGGCSPDVAITTFPVDNANPFQRAFCESDVALVVEGQRLHVHRNILSVYSPVFYRMFHGQFRERGAKEVEIKNTPHDAMLRFLLQMYPVHSCTPIQSDMVLADILPLADFYQVDHIRLKCEDYIGVKVKSLASHGNLDGSQAEQIMLYVLLCEKFRLKKHHAILLNIASKLTVAEMTVKAYFSSLEPATQAELLKRRCQTTQSGISSFVNYFNVFGYWYHNGHCSKCSRNLGQVPGICQDCMQKGVSSCFNFKYE